MNEKDLDQELRAFLDLLTAEKISQGMTPAEARRSALIEFGGVTQVKEECRDTRRFASLDVLRQDLRYGLRALRRNPGFAATVIATLALGVGANAAVFGIVHAVLLRPLPYPQADRLAVASSAVRNETGIPVSPPDFADWQRRNRSFAHLAAIFDGRPVNLMGVAEPERLIAARVSASFFPVMGVQPLYGRPFSEAEENAPVVLLGHHLWTRRFGADPGIVGRSIVLDGRPHTVLGIMPSTFRYPEGQDAWLPLGVEGMQRWGRRAHVLDVVGRLRPGVTTAQAASEMRTIAAAIEREHPDSNAQWSAAVEPLRDRLVGNVRRPLWVLLGAVGFVLLIACGNVANLLLARGTSRRREIAIRTAIGAGRSRVVRQLLTESLILSTLGSALGLGLAFSAERAMRALFAANLPRASEISPGGAILWFTLGIAALTTLLFGLAPAWQAARAPIGDALKSAGRNPSAPDRSLLRSCLVAGQLALALVLLAGAGLLLTSFLRVYQTDPGFRARNLLTLRVSLPAPPGANDPSRVAARIVNYYDTALERLRVLPGVESAAATATLPLTGGDPFLPFTIEGDAPDGQERRADVEQSTAGYFRAMGIPVLRGRVFDVRDRFGAPPVAIVNAAFVQQYCAGRDPLGRRVVPADGGGARTIIGVIGNVRHRSLEARPIPELYLHQAQWPSSGMTFVIRTAGDPASLAGAARDAVRSVEPAIPVYNVRAMTDVVAETVSQRRFTMLLLAGFALTALLLAAVGVYGVMACLVAQRTREIGIRIALGARPGAVLRLVAGRGLALSAIGVGLGSLAALGLTRFLASLLYEVRPTEPAVFAGVAALLMLAALIACVEPARRALRVDPLTAIRWE